VVQLRCLRQNMTLSLTDPLTRMQFKKPKAVRCLFFVLRISLALVALYVGSYFILMSRNKPAVWDGGKAEGWVASLSSFRWASQWHGQSAHTDWNDLFEPLDKIYFSAFPSQVKIDPEMTAAMK
jgi:hypothetical protein